MSLKKSVLYVLITVLLASGGSFLIGKAKAIVPSTVKFADFGRSNVLFLYKGDISYKNQVFIEKYFELNSNKVANMVSMDEVRKAHPILILAYGNDKGRDVFIDDKGRVFFIVPKSEIRNKHWAWWKLKVGSDNATNIYYCTNADPAMVELVNQIKNDVQEK